MKVVSIGNSFSRNMQRFAHQVAAAAGADLTVVNAYYSGCTMMQHADFLRAASPVYKHQKNGVCVKEDVSLQNILSSEVFDFVTLQPGTGTWKRFGFLADSFPYIHDLIEAAHRFQPQAKLVYNHYWSASDLSTRPVFVEYFGSSREKMKAWWKAEAERAEALSEIAYIAPCAEAVEEAYPLFGERLYRDGYHLSAAGEYLQACLWTEFYTGAVPTEFLPEEAAALVSLEEAALLREAARRALLSVEKTPAKNP